MNARMEVKYKPFGEYNECFLTNLNRILLDDKRYIVIPIPDDAHSFQYSLGTFYYKTILRNPNENPHQYGWVNIWIPAILKPTLLGVGEKLPEFWQQLRQHPKYAFLDEQRVYLLAETC